MNTNNTSKLGTQLRHCWDSLLPAAPKPRWQWNRQARQKGSTRGTSWQQTSLPATPLQKKLSKPSTYSVASGCRCEITQSAAGSGLPNRCWQWGICNRIRRGRKPKASLTMAPSRLPRGKSYDSGTSITESALRTRRTTMFGAKIWQSSSPRRWSCQVRPIRPQTPVTEPEATPCHRKGWN